MVGSCRKDVWRQSHQKRNIWANPKEVVVLAVYWQDGSTVGCWLGWPTWLSGFSRMSDRLSASSDAHRCVLLPFGALDLLRRSAGCFHILPSLILITGLVFNWERCRGIHPSIRSINLSPGHYPGIRCTHPSVTELPAAVRSLFTSWDFHLNQCWQRRGPSSGQWPGNWTPSGGFHRSARVGWIHLSCFALARGGFRFCWEIWVSSRAESGCCPDPCALADASVVASFFFWATISSLFVAVRKAIAPQDGP
jgi:hypothetical protein